MKTLLLALLTAAAMLAPASAKTLKVQLVNSSGVAPERVYIMLTGGNSADGKLKNSVPKQLSKIPGGSFTLVSPSSVGRLYISFDKSVKEGVPFTSKTRFDWVELTYLPPGVSVANLTAVDQYGIPLVIQALTSKGKVMGYASWAQTGKAIEQALGKLAPGAVVKSGKSFVRVQSPSHVPSKYASMAGYVASVVGQTVTIIDEFNGPAPATPVNISYSGMFQPDGTITLSGTMTQNGSPIASPDITVYGPSPANPPADIPALTMAQQIYPANGPYFRSDTGTTYHTAGENNAYSVVYRDLMSGFNNGFIGGKYGNNSTNWVNKPAFAAARVSKDGFYNAYAELVEKLSAGRIYGYAFSDNTTNLVQVSITNASMLRVTILSDTKKFNTGGSTGPFLAVKARHLKGSLYQLRGKIRSIPGGVRRLTVSATSGGTSHVYKARVKGTTWIVNNVRRYGSSNVLRFTAQLYKRSGGSAKRTYRINLPG